MSSDIRALVEQLSSGSEGGGSLQQHKVSHSFTVMQPYFYDAYCQKRIEKIGIICLMTSHLIDQKRRNEAFNT